MKAAAVDILVRYLEEEGVEYVFGVPGGHLLPFYDAIHRSRSIASVLARHEAGAAFMAYGYAATSGKLGVCCATVGPGATNLITGVASAFADSVPMLVITAQVGTTVVGKGALQEGAGLGRTIDQVGIFERFTKFSTMPVRGEVVPHALRRAIRAAHSGRPGPVHLDLPADVQAERISDAILPPESYRPYARSVPAERQLDEAASFLKSARRPAILIGAGAARACGQGGRLQALAEAVQAPVATTLRAKGFMPEDHALSLGCAGLYGTEAANAYLKSGVDVLLTVGTSFHEFTSNVWDPSLVPSRALIQVDVDPDEIGKNYPVTVCLVGDAASAVAALEKRLRGAARSASRMRAIAEFKRSRDYFVEQVMHAGQTPIKPQRLMHELRQALPSETVVFADIGNTIPWAERYFQVREGGSFHVLSGMAAMGSAVAACIGGQLGRPGVPVVCLCGDGAFHMTGMEIATAAAARIPVIWVILKNCRLGMTHDVQSLSYQNRHIAGEVPATDFVMLARALGCRGHRASAPAEIGPLVQQALDERLPAVLEVTIDPLEKPPMKARMAAMRQPLGLPDPLRGVSVETIKAVVRMATKR